MGRKHEIVRGLIALLLKDKIQSGIRMAVLFICELRIRKLFPTTNTSKFETPSQWWFGRPL